MQGSCNWEPPGWGWVYVLHFQSSLPSMVRAWEGSWHLCSFSTGAAPTYESPLRARFQSFIATNHQHTSPVVGNPLHVRWNVEGQLFKLASNGPSSRFVHPKLVIPMTSHHLSQEKVTGSAPDPQTPLVQGGGNWISTVGLALLWRGAAHKDRASGMLKALEKGRFRSAVSSNPHVQIRRLSSKINTWCW